MLQDVNVLDVEGWIVSQYLPGAATITNREPAILADYSLAQSTLEHSELATYTIEFKPINPLPATGSVEIAYPSQVTMV